MRRKSIASIFRSLCVGGCVAVSFNAADAQEVNRNIKPLSVQEWRAFDETYLHPERTNRSIQVILSVYDLRTWSEHWMTSNYVFQTFDECQHNLVYTYLAVTSNFKQQGVELRPVGREEFIISNADGGPKVVQAWCAQAVPERNGFLSAPGAKHTQPDFVRNYAKMHKIKVEPEVDRGSMLGILHPEQIPKK
jgi:hypothetical protein